MWKSLILVFGKRIAEKLLLLRTETTYPESAYVAANRELVYVCDLDTRTTNITNRLMVADKRSSVKELLLRQKCAP